MKVALVGNPNSGKTSVFNQLTGLNQKVGNYPGITVDKKIGRLNGDKNISVLDLPGSYSIYPKSADEEVVTRVLTDRNNPNYPDLVVVIADISNLERNLLLFSQIHDLGLPTILALNMIDVAKRRSLEIDIDKLSELFRTQIVRLNARKGIGIKELKEKIRSFEFNGSLEPILEGEFDRNELLTIPPKTVQREFAEKRNRRVSQMVRFALRQHGEDIFSRNHRRVDKIMTHPVSGYLIFLGILFLMFQAIYAWAEWPMDLIDNVFLGLSRGVKQTLPAGVFTNLIAEGLIPGVGGVVIFIPQIALLFTFIFLMEETGYMARVVFIMDRLMRPFGLNGRSVVPLISGVACAIPAIMATRTIDNWKERMITIMVTPLMSCSARLPVYTLLIALIIPDMTVGVFNLKGLVLLGLYLAGLVAALLVAMIFKFMVKAKHKSFLIMELPLYKMPRWENLLVTVLEKVKVFVWEAGKVIVAISIILWVLASYGPVDRIDEAVNRIPKPVNELDISGYENKVAAARLSNSYIGIIGNAIEPVLRPLGYNWQIGIALITSFAAREVFVGSMATIYSVGENFQEGESLLKRMQNERNPNTGELVYNLASGVSLMIFYAFAMQCMSTLAIVLRETKSWKWPFIQMIYMTTLAYVAALITFQILK